MKLFKNANSLLNMKVKKISRSLLLISLIFKIQCSKRRVNKYNDWNHELVLTVLFVCKTMGLVFCL